MNKTTFLAELEKELAGVTPDERVAALQYYKEYFDDAGPEHEADVLAHLGSPQQIAKDIKASSGELMAPPEKEQPVPEAAETQLPELTPDTPPVASSPFNQEPPAAPPVPPEYRGTQPNQNTSAPSGGWTPPPPTGSWTPPPSNGGWTPPPPYRSASAQQPTNTNNNSIAKIILIILAAMFVVPIGGGLMVGLFGTLFGVLVSILVVLFIPFILAFSFTVSGIAMLVGSIFLLAASPANGLLMLGVGFILTAVGILFGILGVTIFTKVLPPLFRGTSNFIKKTINAISRFFGSLFGTRTN